MRRCLCRELYEVREQAMDILGKKVPGRYTLWSHPTWLTFYRVHGCNRWPLFIHVFIWSSQMLLFFFNILPSGWITIHPILHVAGYINVQLLGVTSSTVANLDVYLILFCFATDKASSSSSPHCHVPILEFCRRRWQPVTLKISYQVLLELFGLIQ